MLETHNQADNPFASPETNPTSGDLGTGPRHYGPATQGQRFLNLLIDYVGFMMFAVVVGGVIGVAAPNVDLEQSGPLMDRVWGMGLMLLYYVGLEGVFGRTLGKLVTGTMVLNSDDESRPGPARLLGRTAARFVPFEAFSFLGGDASGWHDRWSNTRVVRLRPGPLDDAAHD